VDEEKSELPKPVKTTKKQPKKKKVRVYVLKPALIYDVTALGAGVCTNQGLKANSA
jgi:hypothetical protein